MSRLRWRLYKAPQVHMLKCLKGDAHAPLPAAALLILFCCKCAILADGIDANLQQPSRKMLDFRRRKPSRKMLDFRRTKGIDVAPRDRRRPSRHPPLQRVGRNPQSIAVNLYRDPGCKLLCLGLRIRLWAPVPNSLFNGLPSVLHLQALNACKIKLAYPPMNIPLKFELDVSNLFFLLSFR